MTIRDLMEQGIEIQGAYKIQKWNDEKEITELLEEGEDFRYSKHSEELLDMEIKYIYSMPKEGTIQAYTIFEVEKEE